MNCPTPRGQRRHAMAWRGGELSLLERFVLVYEDGIESVRCERDELYSSWDTRVFCTHGAG